MSQLVLLIGIFFAGGLIKGALGFGLPLATMAVLPLVVPVDLALALNAIILPVTNVTQFVQAGRMRETVLRFRHLIGGVVIGVPVGAAFVSAANDNILMLALGLLVIVFSAISALKPHADLQAAGPSAGSAPLSIGVGALAGIVGALTTANGPVFIMYLVRLKVDRGMFVSALGLLFIVSGLLIAGSFWIAGMMNIERVMIAVMCIPSAITGMYIGDRITRRVSADRFNLIVLAVLCILGINLFVQGAKGL